MPGYRRQAPRSRYDGPYTRSATSANTGSTLRPQLTSPNGVWILRSEAEKVYDLAPRDLDSILPISCVPNPRGGKNPVMKYNECDVVALADKLAPTFGPDERAERDGPQIQAASARKKYKLHQRQLDRIKPTDVQPFQKYGKDLVSKYYNRKDVMELARKVDYAATHPTVPAPPT